MKRSHGFTMRSREAAKEVWYEKEADFIAQVVSVDGTEIATIDKDGTIELWNAHTDQLIERVYRGSRTYGVSHLTFSPDKTQLLIHYKLTDKLSDSFSIVRDFVRRPH